MLHYLTTIKLVFFKCAINNSTQYITNNDERCALYKPEFKKRKKILNKINEKQQTTYYLTVIVFCR